MEDGFNIFHEEEKTLDLLLQLKNDYTPEGLRMAIKEIVLLADHDGCTRILEAYHAHRYIIDIMANHKNAGIQEVGCTALSKFIKRSLKLKNLIIQSQAHRYIMQAISNHLEDGAVLAAAFDTVSYLASSSSRCLAMFEKDILETIFGTMRMFPNDVHIQTVSCKALSQLLRNDSNHQLDVVSSNDYHLILSAIKYHSQSVHLLQYAFRTLQTIANIEEACENLLSGDIHLRVMNAMKHFPKAVDLHTTGCALLEAMAYNDDYKHLLEVHGSSATILKSLHSFPDDGRLQTCALSALDKLSDAVLKTKSQFYSVGYDWLEDITLVMGKHRAHAGVQEAACRVLCKILQHQPQLKSRIGEDIHQLSIHVNVMASIMLHEDDSTLYCSACRVIYILTTENETLQDLFMEKGAYIPILKGLHIHLSIPKAQQLGCQAIRGLTLFCLLYKETLVSYGALSDIIAALVSYPEDLGVAQETIGVLACLADIEIVRHQCITEGIHELIVDSMVSHTSSQLLQEMALEALAVLSTTGGVYDGLLRETGALESTLKAMKTYVNSPAIQKKGLILLQVLIDSNLLSSPEFCQELTQLINSAMSNFQEIFGVQAEGCVAMQILAEMSDTMAETLVEHKSHENLFYIMDNDSENTSLVELACECLFVLSCVKDLKNQILLSASEKGLTLGVECLLQLDADVNVGEGINTPLCYACQRQDIEMVWLLLKQRVTDMQTALRLSLDQKSNSIIGLLLKHMGHDKEAGIVSWSGLDLCTLHPEWFYPTVMGRTYTSIPMGSGIGKELAHRVRKSEEKREKRRKAVSEMCGLPGLHSRENKLSIRYPWYGSNPSLHSMASDSCITRLLVTDSTDDESGFSEIEETRIAEPRRKSRHAPLERSVSCFIAQKSRIENIVEIAALTAEEEDWQRFSITSANLPSSPQDPRSSWYSSGALHQLSPFSTRGEQDEQSISPRSSPVFFTITNKADSSFPTKRGQENQLQFSSRTRSLSQLGPVEEHSRLRSSSRVSSTSMVTKFQLGIKHMDLSSNQITTLDHMGLTDSMLMSKFSFMERMDLSNNSLTDFPTLLASSLPNLQQLDLRANKFVVFPSHILTISTLQILDLSHNKIQDGSSDMTRFSPSLRELSLSHNELTEIPKWIGECVPLLEKLSLEGNQLEKLPDTHFLLKRLKVLNLSHNNLQTIPPDFFTKLVALDTLHLSHNQLESLPDHIGSRQSELKTLILSHNRLAQKEPLYIPKFILQLKWLRNIDLSHNELSGIPPPSAWKSQTLREILLSHNNIKKLNISDGIKQWMLVERLSVSHNLLQEVPKEFGQLVSLTSLNFNNNKAISTIPDELGKLQKLWELPLNDLKLDLDPVLLKGRTKDIIGFLNEKLKRAVPYYRMKVMLVGFGGRGKSTLLRQLQKLKPSPLDNLATVGIKVKDWKLSVRKGRKTVQYCLSTWDFAGQEDFYSTHPIFLSQRALYLVVYDVSRGPDEVITLKPWLLTINARSPNCPIIVVGTHKDRIQPDMMEEFIHDMRERILKLCKSPGFPQVKGYIEVCSINENPSIEALRRLLFDVIDGFKVKGQPVMGQMIPHSYMIIEELIHEEARVLKSDGLPPILQQRKLLKLVRDADVELDEDELSHAVRFLHESGVLLHYDDPSLQLKDLYFVDPEWLCKMMAQIVTVREINPFINKQGVLKKKDIHVLFSNGDFPAALIPQYQRLLQKFEIAIPKNEDELLIPCKMPVRRPRIQLPAQNSKGLLHRRYDMPYIPIGFWSRLICRLLLFSKMIIDESDSHQTSKVVYKYWREGIYVCRSPQEFFLVEPLSEDIDMLEITTPCTKNGIRLLGHVVDHIDILIEEWFPGLCVLDPMSGKMPIQRLVPCVLCEDDICFHDYILDELVVCSDVDDEIKCPKKDSLVPLYKLAPDVVLGDLEDRFQIDYDRFQFEPNPEHLLGDGSYGSVYRAYYKNQPVAVKVFSPVGDIHPHRMLRQEVTVLRKLRHLSLISMIGVGLRPRILVMELAPLGSLSSIQNADRPLSRGLQHRIALQVAEGLMFLHQHRIIYRDLKPDNVLVFSLSSGVLVNAKISDYGISRFATPLGLTASEGTPGYRAPEVAKGDVVYSNKIDVYSFGILLYELVTGGRKPFEELAFRVELDEAVMKGRRLPQISDVGCAAWPDVQDLIHHCLEQVPEDRPTSEQVFDRINSAELLCLKKEYLVFKSYSAECVVIREAHVNKFEVWMGGGDSTTGVVSWIIANNKHSPGAVVEGTVLKVKECEHSESRVMCLCCLGANNVLAGTANGNIWLLDAITHTVKHHMLPLSDAVLCLESCKGRHGQELVFAGVASGHVAVFSSHMMKTGPCIPDKILTLSDTHDPVRCMTVARNKLWIGCGGQVISATMDTLSITVHPGMRNANMNTGLITHILVGKHLWLSRRGSTILEVWHPNKSIKVIEINCENIIRRYCESVESKDCIVKSVSLHQSTVWVGTAGGYILMLDTSTHQPIKVMHRHNGPIRAIASKETMGYNGEKSILVSVGCGFVSRPGHTAQIDDNYIYALVWEGNISSQVKHLKADHKRRQEWLERNL